MGFSGMKKIFLNLSLWGASLGAQPADPKAAVEIPAAPTGTATTGAPATPSNRIYIPVGDPNVKKALLAVEPTLGPTAIARDFFENLQSDMDFIDLFSLLPDNKLPTNTQGTGPGTFNIDPYRALGIEFLLKSIVSVKGTVIEAEIHLYDVTKGVEILGRRYPYVSKGGQAARELAHSAGNDIVKSLTGIEGIFRTRLLMSCGNKIKEIYIMDFDGKNIRPLTRDRNLALSPSWSPDGKKILFTSYKPSVKGGFVNPNLYLFNLVSGERKALSSARGLNTGGAFHPKENKIAYTFSSSNNPRTQSSKPEIYVLNLDSNTRTPITSTLFLSVEPSWSPDGQQLVYSSSPKGRPHIFVANADGSGARQLTNAGVYNSSPNWSPLGDKIVFSGQENYANNFNVFTVDPQGSNLLRLTSGSHSSENPVFSPDGRFIAFSSNDSPDRQYRIYIMTSQGSRMRAMTAPNLGHCKQPAWSPRL